jgi:hypothetical protein
MNYLRITGRGKIFYSLFYLRRLKNSFIN